MYKILILLFLGFLTLAKCENIGEDEDKYYLDENRVLLYKVINWWNTESSNQGHLQPCNKPIKYERAKNIIVNYDEKIQKIEFHLGKNFASLISISNSEYINDHIKLTKDNILSIRNFDKKQFKKVANAKNHLVISIKGKVAGLLEESGKISLHNSGDFLKKCFKNKSSNKYPFILEIYDRNTQLEKYDFF